MLKNKEAPDLEQSLVGCFFCLYVSLVEKLNSVIGKNLFCLIGVVCTQYGVCLIGNSRDKCVEVFDVYSVGLKKICFTNFSDCNFLICSTGIVSISG